MEYGDTSIQDLTPLPPMTEELNAHIMLQKCDEEETEGREEIKQNVFQITCEHYIN